MLLSNVERSEIFDDKKNVYDKVQPCNIPVKAGELIGYTGAYGFEQNPNYRAAHIEVFTGDEVSDFLADSKNDGEKEKKYFKLLQGAVLKKAMPYKLVQETSVKIISEHGNFTQVEVGPLIREAYKIVGGVEHLKYQPLGKYYDIVGDHFETVNCNFNNSLNKSDKLYLVKELAGDLRRLRYDYPIKGEKYWVPSSAIQRDTPPPPPAAPLPAIDAIAPAGYSRQANTTVDSTAENATTPTLAASETAIESAPTQSPTTNQAKLIVDVEELYLEYPDDCEEDDKIPEDIIVKTSDFKKVKHNDGTYSYLILCECFEKGIGVTKKGWISDTNSKLKKISAYNWEEFGFKVIKDNQDELIYTPDAPPQFLKDVWKQIDADGNNVLTEQELRYTMKNKSISKKLSHLICLHTSEWSYKESKLSSLKNKLNTLFDEGIKQEEDAACKQELKDKRKAVLDAMEARVKNLSWWKEVQDNTLFDNNPFSPGAAKKEKKEAAKPVEIPFAPEEELKGPTLFPVSDPKVYHFHPLAFVRQMRRHVCSSAGAEITKNQLKAIAGISLESNLAKHIKGINLAFKDCEIDSCLKRIHFLAQIFHESGNLQFTRELGVDDSAYGGYPGRGLIQLTGSTNYASYGDFANEDVTTSLANKKKLEEDPHAAKSAGWFWHKSAKLNDDADANDFIYITRIINGGFNGYNERLKYVKRGVQALLGTCSYCQDVETDYLFKDSKAFNDKRASFAWGLWHDPGLNKQGCTKDKEKAIEGYERLIALTSDTFSDTNWYLIRDMPQFENIKYSKSVSGTTRYYVKVRKAAEKRLEILKD